MWILLSIILGLVAVGFMIMAEHSIANEWFSDYNNCRKFRKRISSEGVFVNIMPSLKKVNVHFSSKGVDYQKDLSFLDAKEVYDDTENGGVRKRLKEFF